MFSLFKSDPLKKLRKEYADTLEKAMLCQRSGDIRQYSFLTEQAEAMYKEITRLEGSDQAGG
ncbi:DUF6435 family protein [Alcanivorax sp. 1008]|uniref:DUF6435 family protein n=1 Tax=Alcanivorax sp. 1008 TaxID=2816853 RepID=UPI001D9AE1CF|nr:DUF6435 family protein [Alcanivorax sp. 1008]MCC1497222.1 Lacal_2735 family protein [Alcanivorax sp. 1008]